MKNSSLDQKCSVSYSQVANAPTNVQRNSRSAIPEGSILEKLIVFAFSVPDFRRTSKGNIRHRLGDIIILMIFARMSDKTGRADIIEFGNHNLKKFQSMNLLKNGVPSEPTLCRIESGLDAQGFSDRMAEFIQAFHAELIKAFSVIEIICIDGKAMRGTVQENGRNPDIVSAYSFNTGLTLAKEACREKSNEIKAVPLLLGKIRVAGKLITADAMSMQKEIVDLISSNGGYYLIELKANQPSLRYGVEDKIEKCKPRFTYSDDPDLGHGRIERRTYHVYDGLDLIADKDKWGGSLTVVKFESHCIKKSTGEETSRTRLYMSNLPIETPWIGRAIRNHWSIESMHWALDYNLHQDRIKRKSTTAAKNLDTIQRVVLSIFSIWKGLRKKLADKKKGTASIMRKLSYSFTSLIHFLCQK